MTTAYAIFFYDLLDKFAKQLIQHIAVNVFIFIFCHNSLGHQADHFPVIIRIPSGYKGMAGFVSTKIQTNLNGYDIFFPELLFFTLRIQFIHDLTVEVFRMITKLFIDGSFCPLPHPNDQSVIINCTGIFLTKLIHVFRWKIRIIENRVLLQINIQFFVIQELFQPVCWMFRVACSIKAAVRLVQTGFQHLEHFFVPFGNLITVTVFDAGSLDLCYLTDLFSSQTVSFLSADMCHISVIDLPDQLFCVDLTHRL